MQLTFDDLWYLDTEKPKAPAEVRLLRCSSDFVEIKWTSVRNVDEYQARVSLISLPYCKKACVFSLSVV